VEITDKADDWQRISTLGQDCWRRDILEKDTPGTVGCGGGWSVETSVVRVVEVIYNILGTSSRHCPELIHSGSHPTWISNRFCQEMGSNLSMKAIHEEAKEEETWLFIFRKEN